MRTACLVTTIQYMHITKYKDRIILDRAAFVADRHLDGTRAYPAHVGRI